MRGERKRGYGRRSTCRCADGVSEEVKVKRFSPLAHPSERSCEAAQSRSCSGSGAGFWRVVNCVSGLKDQRYHISSVDAESLSGKRRDSSL